MVSCLLNGCSALGLNSQENNKPISNPFPNYQKGSRDDSSQNMILRTKKGDRSIELEIPGDSQKLSDFVLPLSPTFKDSNRSPASGSKLEDISVEDNSYKNRHTTLSDREITGGFSQGAIEDQGKLRQIEQGLSLGPIEDSTAEPANMSYLASLDHIKQLYRVTRYEAALIELDEMIQIYQTDAKLYEMRGTLLDRLGRRELALKSWNQALRFDSKNEALRKFIDRKQLRIAVGAP